MEAYDASLLKICVITSTFSCQGFYHGENGAGDGRHGRLPVLSFHQPPARPDPVDRRLFVERRAGLQRSAFVPGVSALSRTSCTYSAGPQASACSQTSKRGWWRPCAVLSEPSPAPRNPKQPGLIDKALLFDGGVRGGCFCLSRDIMGSFPELQDGEDEDDDDDGKNS